MSLGRKDLIRLSSGELTSALRVLETQETFKRSFLGTWRKQPKTMSLGNEENVWLTPCGGLSPALEAAGAGIVVIALFSNST